MSASSSQKPTLHLLRGILRQLKPKTATMADKNGNASSSLTSTQVFVLQQFRDSQTDTNKQQQEQQRRKLAMDYLALKQELAERERLQRIDTGAEQQLSPREMSRRSAARAGLLMPELNPDLLK